jgi:hypothetical protein
VAISFINRRRLERAKKNPPPKLTTDALSLLVFRNIMLDVAALQGEGGREGGPIPGVEVFGHFTTRMGACRLPRPIYARLSGPALEATAWAGSELWVRLHCFVNYPLEPPRVEFVPPLFHPLVCADSGEFSPEALPGQDERGRKAGTGTMPTIRKMLLALVDPLKGSLANPKADMRHIVHADATYAVLHPPEEEGVEEEGREDGVGRGGSFFRREARAAHEEGRGRMMGVVRELYARFGSTLAGEEKGLVYRTLGLGEGGREGEGMMLVATLRVLEQHANECLLEED